MAFVFPLLLVLLSIQNITLALKNVFLQKRNTYYEIFNLMFLYSKQYR